MTTTLKPASSLVITRVPLVDSNGMATWNALKIFQDWDTKLQNGLNQLGQITQSIPAATQVVGRTEGIGTTLQNIDATGKILAAGIDFARAYANKDTDHIADGTGSPLAGGKAAEIALVSSAPVPLASHWLTGIASGTFQQSHCLLYTSPSPRDGLLSRMPSSA